MKSLIIYSYLNDPACNCVSNVRRGAVKCEDLQSLNAVMVGTDLMRATVNLTAQWLNMTGEMVGFIVNLPDR